MHGSTAGGCRGHRRPSCSPPAIASSRSRTLAHTSVKLDDSGLLVLSYRHLVLSRPTTWMSSPDPISRGPSEASSREPEALHCTSSASQALCYALCIISAHLLSLQGQEQCLHFVAERTKQHKAAQALMDGRGKPQPLHQGCGPYLAGELISEDVAPDALLDILAPTTAHSPIMWILSSHGLHCHCHVWWGPLPFPCPLPQPHSPEIHSLCCNLVVILKCGTRQVLSLLKSLHAHHLLSHKYGRASTLC